MQLKKKSVDKVGFFRVLLCKVFYKREKQKKVVNDVNTDNANIKFGKVDSLDFAIYLSKKARALNLDVNVTKIQKWLYICYGLYFAATKEQLLNERPKVWDYGPAFPKVHSKQKKHKDGLDSLESSCLLEEIDDFEVIEDIINATLAHFGKWSASALVSWTHEEGKAWYNTKQQDGMYIPIDNNDIYNEFKGYVAQ